MGSENVQEPPHTDNGDCWCNPLIVPVSVAEKMAKGCDVR